MSRGFYALTSGMITQQKKIDISGNNISNINTAGYKKEQAVTTTFGSMFINKYKQRGIYDEATPLNTVSVIRTMEESNTFHSQGIFDETGLNTDFAITGQGFFRISNGANEYYTRNGSFNVDAEGYLALGGRGRVQGEYGDVYIGTDKFTSLEDGSILVDGEAVDKIGIYDFEDYNTLTKAGEGMYTAQGEPVLMENPQVKGKTIERSNVDVMDEMTNIIESQRALQTASQAIKMYDLIQEKAVTEIAKIN